MWRTMGPMSFNYFYVSLLLRFRRICFRVINPCSFKQPLMDDYMSAMAVDRPKMLRLWTWEDSSKIVAFLNINIMKSKQFGLDMPHQNSRLQTKEELKQKEDELTEYFLQEMRKPAAS